MISQPTRFSAPETSTPMLRGTALRRGVVAPIAPRIIPYAAAMRIVVVGAGHVGRALVDALHDDHELVVIDADDDRLATLRERYDVRTVAGDGTTRGVLRQAGVEDADLLIACSPREEVNLVCAMLVKRLSNAQAIVRTTSRAYLDAWREREIEVDFMVSSELETANAISAIIGIPAARQTDVFAEGTGADRRVRRAAAHDQRRADRPPAAPGRDPGRFQGRRDHPRRTHDRPPRRRGGHAR